MKGANHFVLITVLTALVLVGLIVSGSLLSSILDLIKKGGVSIIASIFIMVIFFISVSASGILGLIDIPMTIKSIRKSDKKAYPIICFVIATIALIAAIIFIILILISRK